MFLRKNHLLRYRGWSFSSKLDLGSQIIRIAKTASKKIGALIRSMEICTTEVAFISTSLPYGLVWNMSCLGWSTQLLPGIVRSQKQICSAVGLSLAASLKPQAHCRNVASLSFFYRFYFGRCSFEGVSLAPLPYSRVRSTHYYYYRLHNFSFVILRCFKDIYVSSSFLVQPDSGILCAQHTFL